MLRLATWCAVAIALALLIPGSAPAQSPPATSAAPTDATLRRVWDLKAEALKDLQEGLVPGEILPSIGGAPISVGGRVIGAIGCGGGSGEQDHQCAMAGAAAV
jgi:uncharacterized protein GlcG (DUF336 family)